MPTRHFRIVSIDSQHASISTTGNQNPTSIDTPLDPHIIKSLLNDLIPQSYHDQLTAIYQQERELINQRRQLLTQFNTEFAPIAIEYLENLPTTHPEYFI